MVPGGMVAPAGLHRLALGLELIDAATGLRAAAPLVSTFSRTPEDPLAPGPAAPAWPLRGRTGSTLVVRLEPHVRSPLRIKITDPSRTYIPRLIDVPFVAPVGAGNPSVARRSRRIVLYPGAAYPISDTATGLRGRVLRRRRPLRWARIEARLTEGGPVIARAHGDDRGEFLLLLDRRALPDASLPEDRALDVRLTVFAPTAFLGPPPEAGDDDFGLPIETAAPPPVSDTAPPPSDPAAAGEALPNGYAATGPGAVTATATVSFALGRMISRTEPPVFSLEES
jgi:hypothetical protein